LRRSSAILGIVAIPDYQFSLEQCDVPKVRRAVLSQYRTFRRKCLEYLRGDSSTSVMNQVYHLAWQTAVFRTLNEARRLEPNRMVNGAMWELLTEGYANIMTLGIRRLVDDDPRTDSVWNVIVQIERRPELLRREHFVCFDGLPYDYARVLRARVNAGDFGEGKVRYVPTAGPEAWGMSQLMHEAFDALAGYPERRRRLDIVDSEILRKLKKKLADASVQAVKTMADRVVAHAERVEEDDPLPTITYETIDTALRHIVGAASFLSSHFLYDTAFGSVVPVPQFNVLEALDQPWVTPDNLPALHEHWHQISAAMGEWADGGADILPPRPSKDA
jgi:hypothetical protein